MSKINICIPVYYRDDLVKNCLECLRHTNTNGLDVVLNIGLNGVRNSFIQDYLEPYVLSVKGSVFSDINVFDPGENIGKAKIINHMANTINDFDYLVSIDSDMQMTDDDWLVKFVGIFEDKTTSYRIGALCANQINNSFHKISDFKKISIGGFSITCTPGNSGIAGGVMITDANTWNTLGGYRANKIFGDDDTIYAIECYRRGLIMGYVDEILFFHPSDTDVDYLQWKGKAKANVLEYFETNGYYELARYEN